MLHGTCKKKVFQDRENTHCLSCFSFFFCLKNAVNHSVYRAKLMSSLQTVLPVTKPLVQKLLAVRQEYDLLGSLHSFFRSYEVFILTPGMKVDEGRFEFFNMTVTAREYMALSKPVRIGWWLPLVHSMVEFDSRVCAHAPLCIFLCWSMNIVHLG